MTLFAMDKYSYSHPEGLHTPFRTRGIGGNKLLFESSDQMVVQGQQGFPLRISQVRDERDTWLYGIVM